MGSIFNGIKRAMDELVDGHSDKVSMVNEIKLLVWTASGASTLAVLACVLVLPQLYHDIHSILDEANNPPLAWPYHQNTSLGRCATVSAFSA